MTGIAEVQARVAAIQGRFGVAAPASSSVAFGSVLDRASATGGAKPLSGRLAGTGVGTGASGEQVVAAAKQQLGVPYAWGGTTPEGFDCSGLVQYVFQKFGVELPRVSRDQAKAGVAIDKSQLAPGDLVFFGSPVDHVGIYAGDGKMVAAPRRGEVVRVQDVDMDAITAARRVLPAPTAPVAGGTGGAAGTAWVGRLPAAGQRFAGAIQQAAGKAGIDPELVAAVAWAESGFQPGARSPAGATGLMQLMPGTARGLGVDPSDPVQNLDGGSRYLAQMLERFGSVELALAAYNAGPTAVSRAGGVPQNGETPTYVRRVLGHLGTLQA